MRTEEGLSAGKENCGCTEDAEPPGSTTGREALRPNEVLVPPGGLLSRARSTTADNRITVGSVPRPVCTSANLSISPRSNAFRARFFPTASPAQWNDWRWQLRNRVRNLDQLKRVMELSDDEQAAVSLHKGTLPVSITPYYASLLDARDPQQALRRTVVPVTAEYRHTAGESEDPLAEEADSPVPGLVHRYPDRVLFLVTGFCASYCRYCTRSRIVGGTKHGFSLRQWERAIAYIESTPAVRDVLLSGGDPLILADDRLEWLLSRLRRIPHVEFLRIGTKVPAVLPQRVTRELVRMLRRQHPVWMSLHFTHPDELTEEVGQACSRLADAGIPLGSQTVLLAGINDTVETIRRLMHGLLKMRVRPYYLYQCDPICGSSHFRTPVERGLEVIRGLRGHTSGYAVPTYVIDAPGGGGKVPLLPDHVVGRQGDFILLRNYKGDLYRYPDPLSNAATSGETLFQATRGVAETSR